MGDEFDALLADIWHRIKADMASKTVALSVDELCALNFWAGRESIFGWVGPIDSSGTAFGRQIRVEVPGDGWNDD